MSLSSIGAGLKTRLINIATLKRVYGPEELPDAIAEQMPVALILVKNISYDKTFSDKYDAVFRVIVIFGRLDTPAAFTGIIALADPSGATTSVKAAIEGDNTLGGAADSCRVTSGSGAGQITWGQTPYLSTEFEVEVYA
jgi:hypothetical protein